MAREGRAILVRSDASAVPWDTFRFDGASPHVVALLYRTTVDHWVAGWEEHVGTRPASMRILATTTRTASPDVQTIGDGEYTITEIAPSDLTRTGVHLTRALGEIGGSDRPLIVYFDSLTVLLQFVELSTAYRFLHALLGHVNAAGGTTYVQFDPAAHEETTIRTCLQLFDEVVDA